MTPGRKLLSLFSATAIGTMLVVAPAAAHAEPVPFKDPAVRGYIGLCDSAGHPITSGKLSDKPFVVRAVSSAPAPEGYGSKQGGKASLYAYQPIEGIAPGDWSGEQMNGASIFSNDRHPMAEGTVLDYTMGEFVQSFPLHWDNLLQLRLYFGAPNQSTYITDYPATVLRIEGDNWRVVHGGTADCTAGKVVSTEKLLLPEKRFVAASKSIDAPGGATLGGLTSSGPSSGASGGGGGSGPSGPASPDDSATEAGSSGTGIGSSGATATGTATATATATDSSGAQGRGSDTSSAVAGDSSGSGGSSTVWLAILLVAAVGALAAVASWMMRRRSTH